MLLDYGFPYSEEYIESMESEEIDGLIQEYNYLCRNDINIGLESTNNQKESLIKRIWKWILGKWNAFLDFLTGKKKTESADSVSKASDIMVITAEKQIMAISSGKEIPVLDLSNETDKQSEVKKENSQYSSNQIGFKKENPEDSINIKENKNINKKPQLLENKRETTQLITFKNPVTKKVEKSINVKNIKSCIINVFDVPQIKKVVDGLSNTIDTFIDFIINGKRLDKSQPYNVQALNYIESIGSKKELPSNFFKTVTGTELTRKGLIQENKEELKKSLVLYKDNIEKEKILNLLKNRTEKDPEEAKSITDVITRIFKSFGRFCYMIKGHMLHLNFMTPVYTVCYISKGGGNESLDYLLSL